MLFQLGFLNRTMKQIYLLQDSMFLYKLIVQK
nr:MAG TPA: hypothetical protein [Caudoviricetes sp.]